MYAPRRGARKSGFFFLNSKFPDFGREHEVLKLRERKKKKRQKRQKPAGASAPAIFQTTLPQLFNEQLKKHTYTEYPLTLSVFHFLTSRTGTLYFLFSCLSRIRYSKKYYSHDRQISASASIISIRTDTYTTRARFLLCELHDFFTKAISPARSTNVTLKSFVMFYERLHTPNFTSLRIPTTFKKALI